MKNLNYLNEFRVDKLTHGVSGDEHNGAFKVKIKGEEYLVIASDGMGWEHVSISPVKSHSIPSWNVMCLLKDMFFNDDEVVMQLHPRKSEYVNNCSSCLHLWRPIGKEIPTPPKILVGLKGLGNLK